MVEKKPNLQSKISYLQLDIFVLLGIVHPLVKGGLCLSLSGLNGGL